MIADKHPARGFSLIELMVTVLIVAILMAIAIPSYNTQVRKARRTEAKTALLDLAGREERFYTTNNATYSNTPTDLGYAGTTFPVTISDASGGPYYQVNIPAPVAGTAAVLASYSITATPLNDQVNDTSCASFTVTSAGAQSSLNSSNVDSTSTCWR